MKKVITNVYTLKITYADCDNALLKGEIEMMAQGYAVFEEFM